MWVYGKKVQAIPITTSSLLWFVVVVVAVVILVLILGFSVCLSLSFSGMSMPLTHA